jgi:ABC-type oligopeptide transport system ATPase subunit
VVGNSGSGKSTLARRLTVIRLGSRGDMDRFLADPVHYGRQAAAGPHR